MKVRLTQRRSADARCAYCHDSLDGVVSSCPRCFTTFHKDCRAHLAQCPTLGCGTTFTASPAVVVETEEATGILDQVLRERAVAVIVGAVAAFFLAAVAKSNGEWNGDKVVVAGFLALGILWPVVSLLRDLPFVAAVQALMRRPPLRMMAEVRSELEDPARDELGAERVFVVNLLGPAGEHVSFRDASVPAWLLVPGVAVSVHFLAEGGPVVLRSARGDVHAVRAERVTRNL